MLTKQVLHRTAGFDFEQELKKAENAYIDELLKSPDVAEGIDAFLQKRPPKYPSG